jgi:hypothetical protein
MMRLFSKIISLIFHPLLFPTYGTIYIVFFAPHYFAHLSLKSYQLSVILIFILTFIFPVVSLLILKQLEFIPSLSLEEKKDRTIPFIAIATFYIWTFFYYKPSYQLPFSNYLIASMMLGAVIGVFVAFFINIFRKISLHALGAGSFLGFLLATMKYSVYDTSFIFPIFLAIAGLIGTARLHLKVHDLREVAIGYAVGFLAQFLAFNIAPIFEKLI